MACNCNNNGDVSSAYKIRHVYGNVLRLAIPLTLRTLEVVDDEIVATDEDFIPSTNYPVMVMFSKDAVKLSFTAVMEDGNVAVVEDKGTIPVGTYDITVTCNDSNGNPYRFNQKTVLNVVSATIDAGIESPIEYSVATWYLDTALYLTMKGEDGVGIADISVVESGEIGGMNTLTITLTDGTSRTFSILNGSGVVQNVFDVDSPYPLANGVITARFNEIDQSIRGLFGDVDYDSQSKRIRFYDKSKTTVLASLDARPFIKDGMVNSVYISNGTLVITFNTDSGHEAIGVSLSSIFNPNNYYDKTSINTLLGGYYNKAGVDALLTQIRSDLAQKLSLITRINRISYENSPAIVLESINSQVGDVSDLSEGDFFYSEDTGKIYKVINGVAVNCGDADNKLIYYCTADNKFYRLSLSSAMQEIVIAPSKQVTVLKFFYDINDNWYFLDENDTTLDNSQINAILQNDELDCILYANISIPSSGIQQQGLIFHKASLSRNGIYFFQCDLWMRTYYIAIDTDSEDDTYLNIDDIGVREIPASAISQVQYVPSNRKLQYIVSGSVNWVDILTLAAVATSGSYNDLSDKPTIPDVSGKADKSEMSVTAGTGANADKTAIQLKIGTSATVLTQHQDISGKADKVTTYSKDDVDNMIANIEAGETVVASVDDVDIVDDVSTANGQTILAAASARMVKEIYANLQALYSNLAGIAFVGNKPTWQSISKLTYTFGLASDDSNILVVAKDGSDNTLTGSQNEGTPMTITISVASGYKFSAVPTATMGGNSITVTQSGSNYTISIGALAGNVVITAAATEIGSYSVSIPSGAMFCDSNGDAVSTPSITEGDNLSCYIRPENGKRWSTTPSSTGATVTLSSGSIYQITASNIQADITISGATETIPTYDVTMPSTGNGIASVALTDTSGNALTSPVVEGTGIKVVITPSSNYRITVGTITMGSDTLVENTDYTVTDNNGVKTIAIASVTGDIVISATAAQVVMSKVYTRLLNVTDTTHNLTGKQDTQAVVGSTYTAQLVVDSGCVFNKNYDNSSLDDVRVLQGNEDITSTAYDSNTGIVSVTITNKPLSIIATATSKTIKITSTAAVTSGIKINNGSFQNINEGETTISITGDITAIEFSADAKSAVTALDFGGAVYKKGSTLYNSPFPRTNLVSLKGLVNQTGGQILFDNAGFPNLTTVDTIGWRFATFRAATSLTVVDVVGLISSGNTSVANIFKECNLLQTITGLDTWDTSNVTSFESLFLGTQLGFSAESVRPLDLSSFDIKNVTTLAKFLGGVSLSGGSSLDSSHQYYYYPYVNELVIGENWQPKKVTTLNFHDGKPSDIKTIRCTSTTPPSMYAEDGTTIIDWIAALFCFKDYDNSNPDSTLHIIVPAGCASAYKSAAGWSTYESIIEEES